MRYTLGINYCFDHTDEAFQSILAKIGYTEYSSGGGSMEIELTRKPTDAELADMRTIVANSVLSLHETPIEQDLLDELEASVEDAASELEQGGGTIACKVAAELRVALGTLRHKRGD